MIRAFLAIPLPPATIDAITELRSHLARRLPEVHWARPETLHLTLRFFGDLPEESLEKIAELMLSIGRRHASFSVTLAGLGAFPRSNRARVFWLGVQEAEPLLALQADLERRLASIGIPPESRPFTPHLTLGRHRGRGLPAQSILAEHAGLECGVLPVDRIILYESRLRPAGAEHIPRRTVPLSAGDIR
jgi:2'-5' RNA ligase